MNYSSEKGQAMVEFALVLPILLLVLGGIIDFGWVFHQQVLANNATREATRYLSVNYLDDGLTETSAQPIAEGKAFSNLPSYIISKTPKPVVTVDSDNPSSGDIKVTVKWNTETFMPVYSKLIGVIDIYSETVMKMERNP